MQNQPIEIFFLFRKSMLAKNNDWMKLITDDVSLIGPLAQVQGKESFIEVSQPFFASIRESEIHQIVEKDNYVITQISMTVEMPTGKMLTLNICEWYEFKANKLSSFKVYFDTAEFLKELASA